MLVVIILLGTLFGAATMGLGVWIGLRVTRPPQGERVVGWWELWRHSDRIKRNRRAHYVLYGVIGVMFAVDGLVFRKADSTGPVGPMIAPLIAVGVGIMFGAMANGYVSKT